MADFVSDTVRIARAREDVLHRLTYWANSSSGSIKHSEILEGERNADATVLYEVEGFGASIVYTLSYHINPPGEITHTLVDSKMLKRLDGVYELVDLGDGSTECTYRLEADLKVPLPKKMKDAIAGKIIEGALHGLKEGMETEGEDA